jgi:hypothetical protein
MLDRKSERVERTLLIFGNFWEFVPRGLQFSFRSGILLA